MVKRLVDQERMFNCPGYLLDVSVRLWPQAVSPMVKILLQMKKRT